MKRLIKVAIDTDTNGYLNDLLQVGKTKALGYLPISTLTFICNQSIENMIKFADKNNLKYMLFNPDECAIGSGALYLYNEGMLLELLKKYESTLRDANVPIDNCENYIRYIANKTVPSHEYPEAYIAIGKTFNDPRFR